MSYKLNINDYEALEDFVKKGITKIIGTSYVNIDNINTIVSKIIKYHDKYDESKGCQYETYIYMIVKTCCYTIKKKSYRKKAKEIRVLDAAKKKDKIRFERDNSYSDRVYEIKTGLHIFNSITDKTTKDKMSMIFFEKLSYSKVAAKFKISEAQLKKEIKATLKSLKLKYSNINNAYKEMEANNG